MENLKEEKISQVIEESENGCVISIKNYLEDLLEGESRFYDDNGFISQRIFYSQNKIHGVMELYENGSLITTCQYENGYKNGFEIIYSSETNLPSILTHYLNDKTHGQKINYYEIGKIAEYWTYDNDLKNGNYIKYFENGNIMEEGLYIKNKKEGIFKKYYESGKIMSLELYQNGILAYQPKLFDENGKEIIK